MEVEYSVLHLARIPFVRNTLLCVELRFICSTKTTRSCPTHFSSRQAHCPSCFMTSSTAAPTNNPSNTLINETALHEYMRLYVDYQENGIDLNELSHIRQLDIHSQSTYPPRGAAVAHSILLHSPRMLRSCARTCEGSPRSGTLGKFSLHVHAHVSTCPGIA